MKDATGYSRLHIVLHWLIFLLFGFNYIFGDGMGRALRAQLGGTDVSFWPAMPHVYVGIAVLVLTLIRLAIRFKNGAPAAPAGSPAWMDLASVWTHRVLYLLLILAPVSGGMVWYGGVKIAGDAHEVMTNMMMLIVGVHAVAAIFHHFILKDGLLDRMRVHR